MSTKTETITLSLKELNYRLPTLNVVQKVNNNVNKILQIEIKGDIVSVETEVNVPVVKKTTAAKTTKTTTTVKKTTGATTTKTSTTAKKSTTTAKRTTTKTTRKK